MVAQGRLVQVHWVGRLGNRMFQYAFGCQYASDSGRVYEIPSVWEGTVLFEPCPGVRVISASRLRDCILKHTEDDPANRKICIAAHNSASRRHLRFVDFHVHDDDRGEDLAFDDLSMMYLGKRHDGMCIDFCKTRVFCFSALVKGTAMYQDLESRKGTYVVAHVRRGDIVSSTYAGGHSAVTMKSYLDTLVALGVEPGEVVWISEDPQIATRHAWYWEKGDMGWRYPEGQNRLADDVIFDFLPDFLTIHFAGTVLRGNSSFSWWAAALSDGTVYSPSVGMRPRDKVGPHWVHCAFVPGNEPHFMGSDYEPLRFRRCECERLPPRQSARGVLARLTLVAVTSLVLCLTCAAYLRLLRLHRGRRPGSRCTPPSRRSLRG